MIDSYFDNYIEVIKKYAVFKGRASRSEFWKFTLISAILSIAVTIIDRYMGSGHGRVAITSVLYSLFMILPSISVAVRRLHDTSRSGWSYFVGLIPIIGPIMLIVYLAQDSTPGENAHGSNPNFNASSNPGTSPSQSPVEEKPLV